MQNAQLGSMLDENINKNVDDVNVLNKMVNAFAPQAQASTLNQQPSNQQQTGEIDFFAKADKYAKLLGYNYQSSKWYEQTYMLFDAKYKKNIKKIQKEKKKNRSILKKLKSIFD